MVLTFLCDFSMLCILAMCGLYHYDILLSVIRRELSPAQSSIQVGSGHFA